MDQEEKRLMEELLTGEKRVGGIGKQLFSGIFAQEQAFPFPRIPEKDQQQIKGFLEQVQHFTDTAIDPIAIDRQAEIPHSVIKGLGQLGVLGMSVPKEFGGLGLSQYVYCKAVEIVAGRCGSTALFINAHQSVGLKALELFGTKEQKARWLAPLARGEQLAAFSLTEPNAGSDAAGIETRAVFDPTKNVYRITGKKQWTTNGGVAKVLTVMAKTEVDTPQGKQDKITAFLVTPDMKGFHVTAKALEKVGMRGSWTANLEFCDVEVPAENILGSIGGGLKICLTVLDYGRTTFGATCTGAAKFLLEHATQHAKDRYQFKKPLAAFGLVKKKLARMGALTYAMDATTYFTAGLVDQGHLDIMLESAMLKVFASESLWSVVYDAMQIYGGRSFFTDHPFERIMRDSRLNTIGEGANEVLLAFIGAVGMRDVGLGLKAFIDALKHPVGNGRILWLHFKNNLSRMRLPKIHVCSPQLSGESRQLAHAIRKFGFAVIKVLKRYREGVIDHQLDLERIANAAISLYTVTAVISKLDHSLGTASQFVVPPQEIAAGKYYCRIAFKMIDRNIKSLFSPNDREIERLSDLLTGLSEHSPQDAS
ncbi:MAG: acyl-CoA dehydrogenase family protein [Parachlamydiaceae bacterium]